MLPITTSVSSLGYYAAAVLWHLRLLRWDFGTCLFSPKSADLITSRATCFAMNYFVLQFLSSYKTHLAA